MTSKIYLVEDHEIVREMVSNYITSLPDFEVCGMAATGEEALESLVDAEVNLVLIDTSLPGMSGIDLVRKVLALRPTLCCVIYSGHGETAYIERATRAGARGYILKGNPDELAGALRQVLSGETYVSEALLTGTGPDIVE
jgi:DNA-binding NarL/FixJ family response regulator